MVQLGKRLVSGFHLSFIRQFVKMSDTFVNCTNGKTSISSSLNDASCGFDSDIQILPKDNSDAAKKEQNGTPTRKRVLVKRAAADECKNTGCSLLLVSSLQSNPADSD